MIETTGLVDWPGLVARCAAFLRREDGAVSADWVMLTAGITVLTVGLFTSAEYGLGDLGDSVGDGLSSMTVTRLDTILK
ncbi:hypothetical protein [Rhodovulum strictum]|uniref:Flp pilus assembly protein, pilin Flp n=1 Tax=Rhodovulum strictum TaxID=58314 RepID=A0A844BJX4_9RHOB|nr:hypothetical protein [Rhodovulum strictum]MRH21243.1 hypothetical protein [Rhodovulum strictum]